MATNFEYEKHKTDRVIADLADDPSTRVSGFVVGRAQTQFLNKWSSWTTQGGSVLFEPENSYRYDQQAAGEEEGLFSWCSFDEEGGVVLDPGSYAIAAAFRANSLTAYPTLVGITLTCPTVPLYAWARAAFRYTAANELSTASLYFTQVLRAGHYLEPGITLVTGAELTTNDVSMQITKIS